MNKRALICGITGQDGSYLAKFLLDKGYDVWGTSRDAQGSNLNNLKKLNILDHIKIISMAPEEFHNVLMVLKKTHPDEIYYLAGQSSVGLSFELPVETIQSISIGALNMLEACRTMEYPIKQYYAGSSECFGDTNGTPANESTIFKPKSPYAVAKASAYWLVENYRESYGLYACTGILFNHESPLRPDRFVTKKIIQAAHRISKGSNEILELGRLDICRDWGWAPEYIEAIWLMLQQKTPEDYVIATGESNSLESFVSHAFDLFSLDWRKFVRQTSEFMRPNELRVSLANVDKANKILGWRARTKMKDTIKKMIEFCE